jgi:hypothetical protein
MDPEERTAELKGALGGMLKEDTDLWYDPLYRALADRTGHPRPANR